LIADDPVRGEPRVKTRRSERIREIKAKETAEPEKAQKQGMKRQRVEQVDPNGETKKVGKERPHKGADVPEYGEKDEPEQISKDALGSAENNQSAPIKKDRAPVRAKRKRDNDVDGGKVAKRNKVAFPEAGETILSSTDGGGDHNGKTIGSVESAEDRVQKKVLVRHGDSALGKRIREDASDSVRSLKRGKIAAAYTHRPDQQSQNYASFGEEGHQEGIIDLTERPTHKVAFEELDPLSGSGIIPLKRKRGSTGNDIPCNKRNQIEQLQDLMRDSQTVKQDRGARVAEAPTPGWRAVQRERIRVPCGWILAASH
jgi:hypothetical protein